MFHVPTTMGRRALVATMAIALVAGLVPTFAAAKTESDSRSSRLEGEIRQGASKVLPVDKADKAPNASRSAAPAVTAPAVAYSTSYSITFDTDDVIGGVPTNSTLSTQYAAATGATFSPNAFSGPSGLPGSSAANWATNTGLTVGLLDRSIVGVPVGGAPELNRRFLHTFTGDWLNENGDASIQVNFAIPISTFSATFAGISNGVAGTATSLIAYNAEGQEIARSTAAFRLLLTTQQRLTVSSSTPITRVVLVPGSYSDWVGVDNINFTTVAATPELVNDKVTMTTTSGGMTAATCAAPYTTDYVLSMNLKNISTSNLVNPFFKVRELDYTGAPAANPLRLMTADGATCSSGGRVGSMQTVGGTLAPGATVPVQFRIAMPEVRRMRFFVDVYAVVDGVPVLTKTETITVK